jgi:hypothetical protein
MIKIFLNITLILVTFFACFLEDIYLLFWPPQPHQTLAITVRAQQAFTYDQEKALNAQRNKAQAEYIPVFSYIPQRIEESRKKLYTKPSRETAPQTSWRFSKNNLVSAFHSRM